MFSPPPARILKECKIVEKQLFGPGPSNMAVETQNALALPLLGHLDTEFLDV